MPATAIGTMVHTGVNAATGSLKIFEPSEMFQIMVSEKIKGSSPDESSDDDTSGESW